MKNSGQYYQYGVTQLPLDINSPPERMTFVGRTTATSGFTAVPGSRESRLYAGEGAGQSAGIGSKTD